MIATGAALVSDGFYKIDGGTLFGRVPKSTWQDQVGTDRQNRVTMGLNCLLLQSGGKYILVDTGIGLREDFQVRETFGEGPTRLLRSLKELGLHPKEINAVVLSHLHYTHAGGSIRRNLRDSLNLTFPNATHYLQRASWEESKEHPDPMLDCQRNILMEVLQDSGRLELLDGDGELFPGLNLIMSEGHCAGHQIALFNHGGERVMYLGDLVPTPQHLAKTMVSSWDAEPERSLDHKRALLKEAAKQGWLLVFAHGNEVKSGYLEERRGCAALRPVTI